MDEIKRLLRYFKYDHLPAHLQEVSRRFHDLAVALVSTHHIERVKDPEHDLGEVASGLRKLLEAKDAFVRAALPAKPGVQPQLSREEKRGLEHVAVCLAEKVPLRVDEAIAFVETTYLEGRK